MPGSLGGGATLSRFVRERSADEPGLLPQVRLAELLQTCADQFQDRYGKKR